MAMPGHIGVIDLMVGIPSEDPSQWYDFLRPLLLDTESLTQFRMPAEYMFRNIPRFRPGQDPVRAVLDEMDRFGVERAMIGVAPGHEVALRALREHPERFFGSYEVNPNRGMEEVRTLAALHRDVGVKAATVFPCGLVPQVPINDKKLFPIYANGRGADKILYAGYFPMGLSLERIFAELAHVPLRDEVWPKFLRENALRVFRLDS